MSPTYEKLFEHVQTLPIIDSHEHLPAWEHKRETPTDVLREYLTHYLKDDLISAGMTFDEVQAIRDVSKPLMQRWKAVEPYWRLCRNTGYARALDLAVKTLYGADRIDGNTLEGINEAFLQTVRPDADRYHKILHELSHIEYCMLDEYPDVDPRFFRAVCSVDPFFTFKSWDQMNAVELEAGISISSFDGWIDACEKCLQQAIDGGVHTLKCHSAYWRPLLFEAASYDEAEAVYNEILSMRGSETWNTITHPMARPLQDYMLHRVMRFANEHGLTVQFHTGLLAGGSTYLRNADPTLLSNLFVLYPNVRFDLFHMGYPYQHALGALGKMFPNVYLDMCWAHVISPAASMEALDEWLDSVPVGKIIAFGGDYKFIDAVYAHQLMARQNVTKVLADKVDNGSFGMDEARLIARRIFYDNPRSIYER